MRDSSGILVFNTIETGRKASARSFRSALTNQASWRRSNSRRTAMRSLRYLLLAVLFGFITVSAGAQISFGVDIGGVPAGPPVCQWGYYSYPPYACAPYGYYGPQWFNGGVFIGAGPWYHLGWGGGWGGWHGGGWGGGWGGWHGGGWGGWHGGGWGGWHGGGWHGGGFHGVGGGGFHGGGGGFHGGGGGFHGGGFHGGGGGFHGGGGGRR
jgi:hypothetical protein